MQELIGAPNVVPLVACERHVATLDRIITHRDDEQRCRVSGNISVGIILEPRHQTCTLRNLMRNLAIFPLICADEIERGASCGVISLGVQGKRGPHRISSEEPCEARTLPYAGSPISRNQPSS